MKGYQILVFFLFVMFVCRVDFEFLLHGPKSYQGTICIDYIEGEVDATAGERIMKNQVKIK